MSTPTRFLDLLEEEIKRAEETAIVHDQQGSTHLADWWRARGADLRVYLDGARLRQAEPSPGLARAIRPPRQVPRRTG
jgi:hypothetical protein